MPEPRPAYKWYVAALLASIALINYVDRTAVSAVFPLLREQLGMSDVALAATGSFFLWSYALSSPLAGRLADRLSRTRVIIWSLTAWSLVTLWTGLARSANELLLTRALLGLAESAYLPAANALLADHHASGTRATALGIHVAGLNFGIVVGGTLAGYAGERFGWRLAFLVLGVVGLLLAVCARLTLRDAPSAARPPERPESRGWSLAPLVRLPSYWVMVVSAMLGSVGTWIFLNWLPLYYKETFGLGLAAAGFSGTFPLQIAAVIGVTTGGYVSDRVAGRHGERRMLVNAVCYLAAAPFLLVFLGRPQYALLSVGIFAFALLRALGAVNEPTVVCDLLASRLRATGLALMNAANCLAGGLGVLAAGLLRQSFGLGGVFAGVSGFMLACVACLTTGYLLFARRDLAREPS